MVHRTPVDSSASSSAASILLQLIEDYHAFNPGGVPVLPYPTPLEFSKQVSRGRPCVYRLDPDNQPARHDGSPDVDGSGIGDGLPPSRSGFFRRRRQLERDAKARAEMESVLLHPAFSWTKKALCEKVTEDVDVAVTPDGRADSLYTIRRAFSGSGTRRRRRPSPRSSKKSREGDSTSDDQQSGHGHGHEEGEGNCSSEQEQEQGQEEEEEEEEEEVEEVFVQPATITMSLSSLFDKLIPRDVEEEEEEEREEKEKPTSESAATTTTTTSTASSPSTHLSGINTHEPDEKNTRNTGPNDQSGRTRPRRQKSRRIHYLQSQNSNLTSTPLSPLLADLPRQLPFAHDVLGDPEAINIWIGTSDSVTSTHRDPYENLYVVLKGCKKFTLYPPVEELCLHATKVRTGHHVLIDDDDRGGGGGDGGGGDRVNGDFEIVLDCDDDDDDDDDDSNNDQDQDSHTPLHPGPPPPNSHPDPDSDTDDVGRGKGTKIPWIPIDPDLVTSLPPDTVASRYPYYRYSHPVRVTVWEGEILYLPSGWFHHVRQECGVWDDDGDDDDDGDGTLAPCIAVNYWYDMDYEGEKYATREMMTRLVETARRGDQS
ncbi:hypothetical protein PV08_03627 [Exophiala spinifera]|uniref:JmjC domain-containing protein n=1 Tax=Exophiala spinifera TaxID=91928 RepID=A0A0D2BK90_9EURO|nr:uncharacterized protein PV08_03627 [Exophiala spinifera]KIW19333.1 hypothetical protein PV08_03627 [Exophiala spinifera]